MITLYGFGRVHPKVIGETRDLRVQWLLEETGLPYTVHGLDHSAGELQGPLYSKISDFRLLPAIEDDGFTLTESGAILLYLAEKSGKLIPSDLQGRLKVTQWCFSALNTVEPATLGIILIDKFGDKTCDQRKDLEKQAHRFFTVLERRLDGREWIAQDEFTVADLLLAMVLRQIRATDLLNDYPRLKSFYERCKARPAWKRTLKAYADRLGVAVTEIE